MDPLRELRKKFWRRAVVFPLGLTGVLLIDEYIKEGYLFKPSDILVPGSHESIILALVGFSVYAYVRGVKRESGKDEKGAAL